MEFLDQLNHWAWFAVALVFLALEVFVSGFVVMWLGFAAIAVGLFKLVYPALSWEWSVIIFSVCSLGSICLWHMVFKTKRAQKDRLNSRGLSLIGRRAPLIEAIQQGRGKVNIDDTVWRVTGSDAPKGSLVQVVRSSGNLLDVEVV